MLKLGLSQNALQVQSHFWHSALGCSGRGERKVGLRSRYGRDAQTGASKMDLQKQVTIAPWFRDGSSSGARIDWPMQLSLFEGVRRWMDDETVPFDIEDDGNRLTKEQIQEIAHSEAYKAELLAFDLSLIHISEPTRP